MAVVFEKEGINTLEGTGEILITILSSLAQEESRNISENIRWGVMRKFEKGKVIVNCTKFMGYTCLLYTSRSGGTGKCGTDQGQTAGSIGRYPAGRRDHLFRKSCGECQDVYKRQGHLLQAIL